MQYRPEIDGLRAVAVLPVLVYHLKVPLDGGMALPGGFLGVDIFFVISGYLIGRILMAEVAGTGRIDIARFYARRARRILPILVTVILATCAAATWVLVPSDLQRLAGSVPAALGFCSNFFWYMALGEYGAQDAGLQPLLHTWSLAIEEQFYLVFPLLLLAIRPDLRPARAIALIVLLCLCSLAVAETAGRANPDLNFFSPVARAWELLLGAVLAAFAVHYPGRFRARGAAARVIPKIALATIAISMATIPLNAVHHPGIATLPCVLATAALIWCAAPSEGITRLLSAAPMVRIGRMSYSLYLWHVPVFALGRHASVDHPGMADKLGWLALTFGLTICGYYLIERPFRRRMPARVLGAAGALSAAILLAFLIPAGRTGLPERPVARHLSEIYGAAPFDNAAAGRETWAILDRLSAEGSIDGRFAAAAAPSERRQLWFRAPSGLDLLIVGNSHGKDVFNALRLNAGRFGDLELARYGMPNSFPPGAIAQLLSTPNFDAADAVMIAPRYDRKHLDGVEALAAAISARGKVAVIVGSTAEFDSPGRVPIFDWHVRTHGGLARPAALNRWAYGFMEQRRGTSDRILRAIATRSGAVFLSRRDLMCPRGLQSCSIATPQGRKVLYDRHHWTLDGAAYLGERAADTRWLGPVRTRIAASPAVRTGQLRTPF